MQLVSSNTASSAPRFASSEFVARPIIFNDYQVRALLSGDMTCTRRLMTGHQIPMLETDGEWLSVAQRHPRWGFVVTGDTEKECANALKESGCCPLGKKGDRLWVREGFGEMYDWCDHDEMPGCPSEHWHLGWKYRADGEFDASAEDGAFTGWKPSIHMPKSASRILLEITAIRAERLRDADDMELLGDLGDMLEDDHTKASQAFNHAEHYAIAGVPMGMIPEMYGFKAWWDKTSGAGSFDANPYVWVAEFKLVSVRVQAELEVAL